MRWSIPSRLWAATACVGLLACPADRTDAPAAPPSAPAAAGTGTAGSEARAPGERRDAPAEAERRVLFVGLDGFDPGMVERLSARGRLPRIARLLKRGATGVLYSEREIRSPALWTTVATGRPREVHGIYDFVTGSRLWPEHRRSEERRLVTSNMRQVPAAWNLASDAGFDVGIVGWLNTWPAEPVNGVMVSPYVALGKRKQVTIKGTVYQDEDRQVYPESRWPEIRALLVAPESVPEKVLDRLVPPTPPELAADYPQLAKYRAAARWSLAHTLTMRAVALHLLEQDEPDLTMVFFEGADSLGHRYWLFRQPVDEISAQLAEAGLPPEGAARLRRTYRGVVEAYYEIIDGIVGELVAQLPEDALVVLASDHGFGDRTGQWPVKPEVPFDGEHRIEGFIALAGGGVEPGSTLYGATLYDITPTLLGAMGLELEPGMEGNALLGAFGHSQEAAPSEPGAAAPMESPFDDEEVVRLRSLGYVQ